jgi:hypothetical protein
MDNDVHEKSMMARRKSDKARRNRKKWLPLARGGVPRSPSARR